MAEVDSSVRKDLFKFHAAGSKLCLKRHCARFGCGSMWSGWHSCPQEEHFVHVMQPVIGMPLARRLQITAHG